MARGTKPPPNSSARSTRSRRLARQIPSSLRRVLCQLAQSASGCRTFPTVTPKVLVKPSIHTKPSSLDEDQSWQTGANRSMREGRVSRSFAKPEC
ncbi:transposase [Roseimaritima multifibrata]|uniref:transposase n=1 Tax=Roseimaritima multifibrata TaxID=1930274 RepID=UPI003704D3FB